MSVVVAEQNGRCVAPIPNLSEVVRMTEEFFSAPVSVETMSDPESPGQAWVVLTVEATGEPKELVQRRCDWHERLARQFPECVGDLSLSICPPAGPATI